MLKRIFTLFSAFLLALTVMGQSTENYSFFSGAVGSLTNMAGSTTLIGPNVNGFSGEANANLILPTDFRFLMMGINFFPNAINVSTSGAINMAGNFISGSLFLPNSNRIGAFNTLHSTRMGTSPSGKVHYLVTGNFPNRILVIEFLNMSFPSSPEAADVTYQVRLYESSGAIDFVYGEMRNSSGSGVSVEIGFGSGNADNQFCSVNKNNEQSSTTSITQNMIDEGIIPLLHSTTQGSRAIFRFTPLRPNSLGGVSISASNSGQQELLITPADNNPGYRFYVYRSTMEAGPYSLIGIANNTTFISSSLAANTTYHYQVYSAAEGALSQFAGTTSGATTPAANIQATPSGGNWNDPATWLGGIVPSPNDNVSIPVSATVNVNVFAQCGSLSVFGNLHFTANVQLITNGNVFVVNGGSIRCNGNGSRGLVINDGDLTNNGTLDFSAASNALIFQLGTTNRIFNGSGTLVGTDGTGTPANTGIIRRFTINRLNASFNDPVYLTIHSPIIISENLNLAFGFIENLSPIYLDNTAVAPGKTAGATVATNHFGSSQTGITGNVIFGVSATYNLSYTNGNAEGILNTGKEFPQNFSVNTLNVGNGFGIMPQHDIQAIAFSGTSPIFYGNHTITVGKSTAQPGMTLGTPLYGTGAITRWFGTSAINPGSANGSFPFRFGNPALYNNRLANIAPVNGVSTGGTVTIRHFDIEGQTNFSQPFFENGFGYVRRSNSYWEITTGNGFEASDIELRFFTEGLPTPEPFMTYTSANISLADGMANGVFLDPLGRLPGYPVLRRSLNASQLNNSFHFGETDPLLPLKLIGLKGQVQNNEALLTWETEKEIQVSHFEVERSINGSQFNSIGRVDAKGGNQVASYSFRDIKMPGGVSFYRLKMKDLDGTEVFTQVLKLQNMLQHEFLLQPAYPNPTRGQTAIRYQLAQPSNVSILLIDMNGRQTVLAQYNNKQAGMYVEQIDLKARTNASGRYQIRLLVTDSKGKAIYHQSTAVIIY